MKNISLSIPNTEKSSRNYGIDMLRIISMIMVIILHIITKSNFLKMPQSISVKNETVTILRMLCFCAVNVYAIISGFVGYIKSSHKYSSLIHLWAQVFFYYFIFGLTDILYDHFVMGESIALVRLIKLFLPVFSDQYWFFTAYFLLFFFMPMLNIIIDHTPKNVFKITAVALIVLI